MSTIYYPSNCDATVPEHICNPCDSIEHGRIRSIAFISNTVTIVDPTSPTEWLAAIQANTVRIIPETSGTFDGGEAKEEAGFGDLETRLTGYSFSLNFKDPNYKDNAAFYNAIKYSRSWKVAYRTETQIHLSDAAVSVVPKTPVADDLNSAVVWEVQVKWQGSSLPTPYDVPAGVFDCFALTPFG